MTSTNFKILFVLILKMEYIVTSLLEPGRKYGETDTNIFYLLYDYRTIPEAFGLFDLQLILYEHEKKNVSASWIPVIDGRKVNAVLLSNWYDQLRYFLKSQDHKKRLNAKLYKFVSAIPHSVLVKNLSRENQYGLIKKKDIPTVLKLHYAVCDKKYEIDESLEVVFRRRLNCKQSVYTFILCNPTSLKDLTKIIGFLLVETMDDLEWEK